MTKTPHVHKDLIIAWSMGEEIEVFDKSKKEWVLVQSPLWGVESKYRIRQRTTVINGFTVPEPLRAFPKFGEEYFVERLDFEDYFASKVYMETEIEEVWLDRGLMHSTKEGAITSCKARLGINPHTGKPVEKKQQESIAMG